MPTKGNKNKIKYGLKNVHYSVITEDMEGVVSYATPVAIKGAVNISLNSLFEQETVPADDDPMYAVVEENNGYEGDLEVQILDDDFKINVLGNTKDANGVLIEHKDAVTKRIALLFEFSGDVKKTRHLLYNCAVKKPNIESGTKGSGPASKTDTLSIKCTPAHDTGNVKAKCMEGETAYADWFKSVYVGTASTTED